MGGREFPRIPPTMGKINDYTAKSDRWDLEDVLLPVHFARLNYMLNPRKFCCALGPETDDLVIPGVGGVRRRKSWRVGQSIPHTMISPRRGLAVSRDFPNVAKIRHVRNDTSRNPTDWNRLLRGQCHVTNQGDKGIFYANNVAPSSCRVGKNKLRAPPPFDLAHSKSSEIGTGRGLSPLIIGRPSTRRYKSPAGEHLLIMPPCSDIRLPLLDRESPA